MSMYATYYSFSPSRADKEWEHFEEDLVIIQQWVHTQKTHEEYEEKKEAILQPSRSNIFDFFSVKGFFIPWVFWQGKDGYDASGNLATWSDEAKMEYLLKGGRLYEKGKNRNPDDPATPHCTLQKDAPELIPPYLEALEEAKKIDKSAPKIVTLNERQKDFQESYRLHDFFPGALESKQEYKEALQKLDLWYGSIGGVSMSAFEEPQWRKALFQDANKDMEARLPSKEEWITLYSNAAENVIQRAADFFITNLAEPYDHYSQKEVEKNIQEYLEDQQAVVEDLQNNADAMLILEIENAEMQPIAAQQLLDQRGAILAQRYQHLFK